MAGLGPMAGQAGHFLIYQEGKHAYATERYSNEYGRLLAVIERRLRDRKLPGWRVLDRGHGLPAVGFSL